MSDTVQSIVSIFVAIVGVAMVAVLVSNRSQTPRVISAFTEGVASNIRAAVSPLGGGGFGGGAGYGGYY